MGILYLVATPIGNMGDISERAVKTLRNVSLIAAEDTRVTGSLLKKLDIKNKMVSYYEHNAAKRSDFLLSYLISGNDIALVSDAGTPAISDPGEDIVAKCIENDIEVIPVPGACAFLSALTVSGFSTKKFTFAGFLGHKSSERKKELEKYKTNTETLIFYEAPHRLVKMLADMSEIFSKDRKICLSREITKKFEEHKRCTIGEALKYYEENPVKGEFVVIAEGCTQAEESNLNNLPLEEHLEFYLKSMPAKEAYKEIAKDRNVTKREIYAYFNKE